MKWQEDMAREVGMISSLLLLAAVLPAWPAPVGFLIGLQLVRSVLIAVRTRALQRVEWRGPLTWMALFYLWHLAGMVWSSDQDFGWMDMGIKASLLVFPLIAWLTPRPGRIGLERVFTVFVISGAVVAVVLLIRAAVLFGGEWWAVHHGAAPQGMPWTNHFFSSYYSPLIHPSYLAWYLAMALATWYRTDLHDRHRKWNLPLVAAISMGVLLCASKMGWIVFAFVLLSVLLHIRRSRSDLRPLIRFVIAAGVLASVLIASVPTLRYKVIHAFQAAQGTNPVEVDSSNLRMQVWDVALDMAAAHPLLGAGTGDVKNELLAGYARKGYLHALEKRLNAHGQFMQSLAALGVVGLLLLLACTLWPLWTAWRAGDGLMALFLLSAILNFSVESMLEVQAGVVFFAFFAVLLTWRRPVTP